MSQPPVPAQEFDARIAGKLTALRLELAMMAREVREQLGLTRAEAAKQGNISVEDLERIETTSVGSVPLEATYEYLYRLGVELHVVASDGSTSVLITDDEDAPAELHGLLEDEPPAAAEAAP